MKKNTKQKIIDLAVDLFNKEGFAAISLQELAHRLGMSRGNLTYHFKDKEALLQGITEQLWHKIEQERIKSRTFPSFQNLHHEVQLYYKIQRTYTFIFLDTHVLKHSLVSDQFRKMTAQSLQDNKAGIALAIKLGNMKPEPFPGCYHHLAQTVWMISFFWLAQQVIRGETSVEDGEKVIWSMLLPHFTEKGIQAFKTFFGEAYYNSLGQAFELDIEQLISF